MLTEYTTPGASVEVRDDESIYSLLTERIKRTGEDTVIAERKTAPGQWTLSFSIVCIFSTFTLE